MEAYRIDRFGSVDARRRHIRRTNDQFVGGYAEYALVEAGKIAPKPAALDYIRAAGLPVVAVTAWQMLFEHARIELGQAVLVRGGAGSVGACATQMAMEAGASVYGTARARDLERVRCGQRDPGGGRRRAAGDHHPRPAQPATRHHGLQHLRQRGRKPAAQTRTAPRGRAACDSDRRQLPPRRRRPGTRPDNWRPRRQAIVLTP